ncbi:lipopolysaccharide biosynthesis protein [Gimibacter soli]|uniref:Lipopolysaccharide biosynthesis protein n=1 Tax=Gimibacter soli TaxID=3024400 RepID=A0AAE9XSD2_9PROT|nr:lipopolysaccharide biosynthesis protein [Gimibacter soli]WCL53165.1 lipopolysaccharide biosynthesis protein [Gimibacter soli]
MTSAISALAVRAVATAFGFTVTFLIAHRLGAEANGQYALVTQTGMLLAVLALGGIDLSSIRFLTPASDGKGHLTVSILGRLVLFILSTTSAIGLLFWLGGSRLWDTLFGGVIPIEWGALLVLVIVVRSSERLVSAVLRSQRRFLLGQCLETLFVPTALAFVMIFGWYNEVNALLIINIVVAASATLVGLFFCLRLALAPGEKEEPAIGAMIKSGLPLLGVGLTLVFAEWFALAVAATSFGAAEAGQMRIAWQVSGSLTLILAALNSVFAPKLAAAHKAGDREALGHLCRSITKMTLGLAIPAALLIVLLVKPLLAIVNEETLGAVPVVHVLVISQLTIVLMSNVGTLLAVTGHEKISLRNALVGTVLLVAFGWTMAQFWGLIGLAVGVTIATLWRNIAGTYAVIKYLRLNPFTGRLLDV